MQIKNSVYADVAVRWGTITLPLKAGTPMSLAGLVANDAGAVGLVPQTITVKPELPSIRVLVGGDVILSEVEAAYGASISAAAIEAMTGIRFYSDDGTPADNLPTASAADAGLVRAGHNVDIADDGTISVETVYDLSGAGAHNAIYRGKALGSTVTAKQYAAIADGSFADLYIGDYWEINNVKYRIAAFDYYFGKGDEGYACATHHIVVVPDTPLDSKVMDADASTADGYVGSDMYTTHLPAVLTAIKTTFGAAHILAHRQMLTTAVTSGVPSAAAWSNSEIALLTEINAYGTTIFTPHSSGASVPALYTIDNSQFPLFAYNPGLLASSANWWLRDIVTGAAYAYVAKSGNAYAGAANFQAQGIRPAFCLKG